jgi:archaemetzincin
MDACGDLCDAPAPIRSLVLSNGIAEPLPEPDRQDWLAIHDERGQTFQEFTRSISRPHAGERTIYVQPVDTGDALSETCLSTLAAFAAAFFQRPTRVLPPLALESSALTVRAAPDAGTPQVYAGDILTTLYAAKPADAFCVLGITARDLFPHPIVSFAFGEASATCRVGVVSVARYGPPFCQDAPGRAPGEMRKRCCRVIAHEIGHMAGFAHCVYCRCLMNGSSSLAESEKRPLHLCPVDLLKLQWLLGFDVGRRYADLERFWRQAGEDAEADWAAGCLRASARDMPAPASRLQGHAPWAPNPSV